VPGQPILDFDQQHVKLAGVSGGYRALPGGQPCSAAQAPMMASWQATGRPPPASVRATRT
jgi:hypothetical protein